jgi:hypothetical protein
VDLGLFSTADNAARDEDEEPSTADKENSQTMGEDAMGECP